MKERYSLGDKKRNLRTNRALSSLAELDVSAAGRACALLNDDFTASLYRGADLKYFSDGGEMYAAMLNDLAQAEKYIFLEYFIKHLINCSIAVQFPIFARTILF